MNMKQFVDPHLFKQRGAVLAFSLIMLLLLTLVSVSMIQQNKSQIAMTSNSIQQTSAFSTVQSALVNAQSIINQRRYKTIPEDAKCNSTNQIHENMVLDVGDPNIVARITQVFCLTDYNSANRIGDLNQCLYNNGSRNLNVGTGTPQATAESVLACTRLNNAGSTVNRTKNDLCGSEAYTITINFFDNTSNTSRTLESKYQVNCSKDIIDFI